MRRAENSTGVDWMSELSISFNPSYQRLVLHHVALVRGGVRLDAMVDADIDFLRVERDMHARIYSGEYSLIVQVRGLEPGDLLDTAYTIEGQNPVLAGGFVHHVQFDFGIVVGRHLCRVLHPADLPVRLHVTGAPVTPERRTVDGLTELRVDLQDRRRVEFESWVPSQFDDQGRVWTLSSFRDWGAVAAWAAALYAPDADEPPVAELVARLQAQTAVPPALAAIAFVQEQVRYVSTNFGEGGYRPRRPALVLQRRYGDCKDKSLLLATLLRALGHGAEVALCSAARPRGPELAAPTPHAFDHVIVRAVIDGQVRWIDATATGQLGPLELRWRPNDSAVLVAAAGVRGLELIPPLEARHIGIVSEAVADLTAGVGQPAAYDYVHVSRGADAEELRRALAAMGLDGVERRTFEAMSQEFGPVEQAGAFEVSDDPATNTVTERNRLRLLDPWRATPDGGREFRQTLCYATSLLPAVPTTDPRHPLLVAAHPLHHRHAERLKLPRGLRPRGLVPGTLERTNAAFHFRRDLDVAPGEVQVSVETRTLAPWIAPDAILPALRDERALRDAHDLHLAFPRRRWPWGR